MRTFGGAGVSIEMDIDASEGRTDPGGIESSEMRGAEVAAKPSAPKSVTFSEAFKKLDLQPLERERFEAHVPHEREASSSVHVDDTVMRNREESAALELLDDVGKSTHRSDTSDLAGKDQRGEDDAVRDFADDEREGDADSDEVMEDASDDDYSSSSSALSDAPSVHEEVTVRSTGISTTAMQNTIHHEDPWGSSELSDAPSELSDARSDPLEAPGPSTSTSATGKMKTLSLQGGKPIGSSVSKKSSTQTASRKRPLESSA